jgi:hypothetical protein
MRGVMVGDVEARMALKMSLSYRTQWVLIKSAEEVPSEEGHKAAPFT